MIVTGNPGLGTPSSYDHVQTERTRYALRVKRQDVDALLERASADSTSLATRRDLWQPTTTTLPHRHAADQPRSIWDDTGDPPPANKPA
jgi:hypothetical protein